MQNVKGKEEQRFTGCRAAMQKIWKAVYTSGDKRIKLMGGMIFVQRSSKFELYFQFLI